MSCKCISGSLSKKKRLENYFAGLSLILIAIAWYAGFVLNQQTTRDWLNENINEANLLKNVSGDVFCICNGYEDTLGYVSFSKTNGYGGLLKVFVQVSPEGEISKVIVYENSETPYFYKLIRKDKFTERFINKLVTDSFSVNKDIDAVSGATVSSTAITNAVRMAGHNIAREVFGFESTGENYNPKYIAGIPEVLLFLLFVSALWVILFKSRHLKTLRWISLLLGLVFVGFVYHKPLTLAKINTMIMGYFPAWHSDLYWYIMVFLTMLTVIISGKNIYCNWICPFGATQECLAYIGKAKNTVNTKYHRVTVWIPRLLALTAIIIGLVLRNPTVSSYEVFSNMFVFRGSAFLFAVLGVVLISSLFIKRPWCSYLCPVGSMITFIQFCRRKAKNGIPGDKK